MYVQLIVYSALIGMLFCPCKSDVTVLKPAGDVATLSICVDPTIYSERTQMSAFIKSIIKATKIFESLKKLFYKSNDEFDSYEFEVVSLNSDKSLQDSSKRKTRNTFTDIEPMVINSTTTTAPQVSTESIKGTNNITWVEKFHKILSSSSTWPDYETIRTKKSNQLQKLWNWTPIVKFKKHSKEIVDYMVNGYASWTPHLSLKKHMNVIKIIGASALLVLFCGLLLYVAIYAHRSRNYRYEVNRLPEDALLYLV